MPFVVGVRLIRWHLAAWIVGALCLAAAGDAGGVADEGASLADLYEQARAALAAGQDEQYERAADAIISRVAPAADFLAARLDSQAERVRGPDDLHPGGILVTINLLGRMNAYPAARAALEKLQAHPVPDVARWARYALLRDPQTRPVESATTTPIPTTQPLARRVEGDRIVTDEGWFRLPVRQGPPRPAKPSKAFVIEVREPISSKTHDALQRKALRCITGGADLVILDMDTWGGEVIAALDIARVLKADLGATYTLCYVRTRGVSAGALIALACDEIVMTPVGKLGDCAPLLMGGTLAGVEREKIETVLRTEFSESAERNGYNVALSESMVSIGREVWLIRNDQTGELRYVDRKDWRGRVQVPAGVATAPSVETSPWRLLRVVVPEGELLTMKPSQAIEYGFASRLIETPQDKPLSKLLAAYDVTGGPVILADTWSERLVGFLIHPAVLGFLLFVGLLCAYIELYTPGFGVPGTIAVVCFAILFGSRFLTGLAQWWEIAVFVVGVALLLVEIFVTPGFGLLGAIGIICCAVGLLAMVVPNAPGKAPWPQTRLAWDVFGSGMFAVGVAFVAALLAGWALSQYLPRTPMARGLILPPVVAPTEPLLADSSPITRIAPGAEGKVVSPCRPVGRARFGEDLLDVVTEGELIAAGESVRVLRRDGNRIVVEKA
ncbi:MAG TPA: NfeD family protein [Phycisphaerae bacterium]|nr:NfeD family protein [Phycisphaerae bacterium]